MGDSLITIVAIFLAAILMFVFPLMSISDRNDDVSQLAAQTETVEFVDNIRSTGKITQENYASFVQKLAATGNSYDIEIEVKVLDENPGKKSALTAPNKIGENIYYSEFTKQIEEEMIKQNGEKILKEGDIVSVSVKNTNTTIAQMLKNFLYSVSGNNTYQIEAQHAGVVMTNGKRK